MTEETIFAAALEKPLAERAAYLADACGDDAAMRKRLEGLLAASEEVGKFMARPAVASANSATEIIDGELTPKEFAVTMDGPSNEDEDHAEATAFLAPATRPDSLGRIGHYEVLQVLGKGGFGTVFRAFDDVLQRVVAVKVMAPQLAATSPARKRFLREARTSAQVRHENVVQVYDVGEQPLPFLVMEFIPGETLQQRLDRTGPLDVSETLRIGKQIAEGLAAAHATDLIHRDIKPANVLLEGGQQKVKITDFGLARAADDASISQSGIIAGTPMYMAPEQALGHKLDQRADLFSLGSVIYQMVAGRPPFRANSTVAVLKRVAEDTPRNIREIIPETPQWLCNIISKLHAKNPDDRYQSAREVADVLADCAGQLKASSKLKDFSRIPREMSNRSGLKWMLAATALLLLPMIVLAVTEFIGMTHLFRGQPRPDANKSGGDASPIQFAKQEPPPLAVAPFDAATAKKHQEAWAKHLGVDVEITNSIGMKFRLIPPGEFMMGSSPEEIQRALKQVPDNTVNQVKSEGPVRSVRIDKPCYLGAHEVTVEQFRRFVKETGHKTGPETNGVGSWGNKGQSKEYTWLNPDFVSSEKLPVVCIEYPDAQAFCEWLSRIEGRLYEIPHESVWEFACRAGTIGSWYWGDQPEVWEAFVPRGRHPVAGSRPNAFGLYDMLGNVQEFARTDLGLVAFRGGADAWNVWLMRSAVRDQFNPLGFKSTSATGFRVALVGDLKPKTVTSIKPFVVLDDKKTKEYAFPTLAEAVATAVEGDIIEIRGNGPYVTPSLKINDRALTIRAGVHCQPVLQLDPEGVKASGDFIWSNAPLALEGLELQRLGKSEPPPTLHPILVNAAHNLSVVNCRFLWHPDPQNCMAIFCGGKSCEVRNCIILGTHHGLFRSVGPGVTTSLRNCVFVCGTGMGLYEFQDRIAAGSHHAVQNTILAPYAYNLHQFGEFAELDKKRGPSARLETAENVLDAQYAVFLFGLNEKKPEVNDTLLRELLAWQEKSNVYQAKTPFLQHYRTGKLSIAGLPDWEQFWGLKNTSSTQGRILYAGGDIGARMKLSPEKLVPADFRLHPSSAGKGAGKDGKDGKDLGADVDLVGPGLAYEKWKKTPEYQDWLKRTAKVMEKAAMEPLPSTFKNSLGMEFAIVPKGKSWLGGGKDKLGDQPVEFSANFYLGKYEVTQEEWTQVMGENPSYFQRKDGSSDPVKGITDADLKRFPVDNVTWDQTQVFLEKLNKLEKEKGWVYRLPKEEEWEYACRGGPMADKQDSAFDFYLAKPTNTLLLAQANFEKDMGLNRTCKVGSYEANRLGIFDMHGNVWEWCEDAEKGDKRGPFRVMRGGAWNDVDSDCLATQRVVKAPWTKYSHRGLRLVRVPSEPAAEPAKEVKEK